mgnify:CR=1 FL=1
MPKHTKRTIAVEAQHTEPRRVALPLKPGIEVTPYPNTVFPKLSPMLRPATVDMVNGKELKVLLTTAGTNSTAVGFKDSYFGKVPLPLFVEIFLFFISCRRLSRPHSFWVFHSPFSRILPVVFLQLLSMSLTVSLLRSLNSLWVFCLVRLPMKFCLFWVSSHRKAASHQRAASTRHAGRRQLGWSIA